MTYLEDLTRATQAVPARAFAVRAAGHLLPHTLQLVPIELEWLKTSNLKQATVVALVEVTEHQVLVNRELLTQAKDYLMAEGPSRKPSVEKTRLELLARVMATLYPLNLHADKSPLEQAMLEGYRPPKRQPEPGSLASGKQQRLEMEEALKRTPPLKKSKRSKR